MLRFGIEIKPNDKKNRKLLGMCSYSIMISFIAMTYGDLRILLYVIVVVADCG